MTFFENLENNADGCSSGLVGDSGGGSKVQEHRLVWCERSVREKVASLLYYEKKR